MYELRTRHSIGADGITQFDGIVSVEGEEYVVGTKWMTEEDFHKLNQLGMVAAWFIDYGFFKEMLYHCVTSDISLSQMFREIVENPSAYPVFNELLDSFDKESKASYFETAEEVDQYVAELVRKGEKVEVTRLGRVYVGKMMAQKEEVLEELKNLVIAIRRRQTGDEEMEFEEITRMLCNLTKDFLVPLEVEIPEVIEWQSRYDVVRWIRDDYQPPLSHHAVETPLEFHLVMNNIAQTHMTNEIISAMDDDKLNMQYYLRNTNSSNVRRRIVYASETSRSEEMHLLNLEGSADIAQSVRPEDFPHQSGRLGCLPTSSE